MTVAVGENEELHIEKEGGNEFPIRIVENLLID
jgi:hypothetical protein